MASTALALSTVSTSLGSTPPTESAAWRPPQWTTQQGATPPPVTLTATDPTNNQQTAYVFDAIIRAEHSQKTVMTHNPVQTGAAVTDNAYIEPAMVVVEIKMSDLMQSYTIGQFAGAPSRSVSAFQTLKALQRNLSVMSLATRLFTYQNVMIEDLRAPDDSTTKYGLNAFVTFKEIIVAAPIGTTNTNASNNSAIPQSTQTTATGQVQANPVPASIQTQNNIDSTDLNMQMAP